MGEDGYIPAEEGRGAGKVGGWGGSGRRGLAGSPRMLVGQAAGAAIMAAMLPGERCNPARYI